MVARPVPSRARVAVPLLLAVVVAGAHYTRLAAFGLYEDDYWAIAPHLGDPPGRLWPLFLHHFRAWEQGRPLNHFLPPALATVGSALGGLRAVYALAACWLALNGMLAWLVARRLVSEGAAVVVAVAYLLFPADGARILLTHAAHVQGAMTFMLAGALLWLAGGWRRWASYPVAALSLLSYELAFLPFLTVPLLVPLEGRRLARTWAAHLGGSAAFVAAVGTVRVATNDSRAADAAHHLAQSLHRMVTSLYLGPATSGASLLRAAAAGLRGMDRLALGAALAVVLALSAAMWAAVRAPRAAPAGREEGRLPWWRLLLAALATWSLAYALTLVNYPPTQTAGRLTSTHVGATWGAALAVGALFEGAWQAGRWRRTAATVATAAWFAALVGYHHVLQRGFVQAWAHQRRFWTELTLRSPDVGPGWAVLVGGTPRWISPAIFANSWSDQLAHRLIHAAGWEPAAPSFAHLGVVGDQVPFRREGDRVLWRPEFWGGPELPIDPAQLALFVDDRGELRRVAELQTQAGLLRATAPIPPEPRRTWPDTPVSRLLFPERFPAR